VLLPAERVRARATRRHGAVLETST
jgi:hypothetical protein